MTWQDEFKQFHDKDETKGSAAWLVSPNIVKTNIERWVVKADKELLRMATALELEYVEEVKKEAYKKALDGLDKIKCIDDDSGELAKDKRQAWLAGQTFVLVRVSELIAKRREVLDIC